MPRSSADIPADLRRRLEHSGVEFRALVASQITDAMAEEMLALFLANFDRWPYLDPEVPPLDHLLWKMSGPAANIAATEGRIGGRLVFASTAFAAWMRIDGARRRRLIVPDICVAKDYQGRGLFSLSAEVRPYLPEYSCDLSLHEQSQTRRNVQPLARKGQALMANRVTSWFRILRPEAWSAHRGRPSEAPIAAAAWAWGTLAAAVRGRRRRAASRSRLTPTPLAASAGAPMDFDPRFDVLFEESARAFDVLSERTVEQLSWRYGDRRAGPFVARVVVEGDRLLGYAVTRPARPRAYLADLLALPDRLDVVEALVADSIEIARGAGAAAVECWLPRHHPYRPALRRQGFFDSGRDSGVQYHAVDAPPEALRVLQEPLARVHYTVGDTDVV